MSGRCKAKSRVKKKGSPGYYPRIILIGPMGAGKSTLAGKIAEKYKLVNVDCGKIIKQHIENETKLGIPAKETFDQGLYADNHVVFKMLLEVLSKIESGKGWILHGYPLTRTQAESLVEAGFKANRIFFMNLPLDAIIKRLSYRMLDPCTGKRYHRLYDPPTDCEIRDRCIQDPKDNNKYIRDRFHEYCYFNDELTEFFHDYKPVQLDASQELKYLQTYIESTIVNPMPHEIAVPELSYAPKILLIGPLGAGKTSVAEKIASRYKLVNVDSGKLIRSHIEERTRLGVEAKENLEKGSYVDNHVIFQMIRDHLEKNDAQIHGWIIHGYPMSKMQAEMLCEAGFVPNRVFFFKITEKLANERLAHRLYDPVCKRRYHSLYDPPTRQNILKRCIRHKEDDVKFISERFREFNYFYGEIIDYFATYQPMDINADQDCQSICKAVENHIIHPLSNLPYRPKILLLGPTGSGKTKLARKLVEKYNIVNIDVGRLIRKHIHTKTQLGLQASSNHSKGLLIDNNVVLQMILQKLHDVKGDVRGWVLHGYPVTRVQAEIMQEKEIKPNRIFMLQMDNDVIMKRFLGNGSLEHDRKHIEDKLHNWDYFSVEVREYYSTADIRPIDINGNLDEIFVCEQVCKSIASPLPRYDGLSYIPKIVIVGPSHAGKSTVAAKLAQKYNLINIDSGRLVKYHIKQGTEVGLRMQSSMKKGHFVDNEDIFKIVHDFMRKVNANWQGWVTSGYPFTKLQAERFTNAGYIPNRVYFMDISVDGIVGRMDSQVTLGTEDTVMPDMDASPSAFELHLRDRHHEYGYFRTELTDFYNEYKPFQIDANMDPYEVFLNFVDTIEKPLPRNDGLLYNPMILLLGPSGCGKTTVAKKLCKKYNLINVDCGQLIKQHIMAENEVGVQAAGMVRQGKFVENRVALKMIVDFMTDVSANEIGWVMHGYPLSMMQADAVVTEGFKPNRVYNMVCSESVIRERSGKEDSNLTERYHEYEYFKTELDQYFKKYKPTDVDASGTQDAVFEAIWQNIEERNYPDVDDDLAIDDVIEPEGDLKLE